MSKNNRKILGNVALILALCIVPFLLSSFYMGILTEVLILGIFALSLNILLGYTGLVSLGHAAYFGVGAYTAGVVAKSLSSNVIVTIFLSLLVSLIIAAMLGYFCTRVSGFYFLMITLAFSQMIYSFVHQWRYVGGSNGMSGIPNPTLFGDAGFSSGLSIYFLVLVVFIAVYFIIKKFIQSPLGRVLVGIRENETRMKAMGYNTMLYKNLSFIIAGGIGGIAGCLYTYFNGFVSPEDVYWTVSGEVLIMVLVGGAGTLLGPVLGAAFIVILETVVSSYTEMWMMIVGAVFILFVIFIPDGIMGVFNKLSKQQVKHKKIAEDDPNAKAIVQSK